MYSFQIYRLIWRAGIDGLRKFALVSHKCQCHVPRLQLGKMTPGISTWDFKRCGGLSNPDINIKLN